MVRIAWVLALSACGRVGFDAIDPSGDGGIGGDGGTASRCGTVALVSDDFSGSALDDVLWGSSYEDVGGMFDQTGGVARVTLLSGRASPTYAAITTGRVYDLTDAEVIAELVTVGNPAEPTAESLFIVEAPGGIRVELAVTNGMIRMRLQDGSTTLIAAVSYSASAHRFLKLREHGGTLYGDVSPDGQTWTPLGNLPMPWDPAYTRVSLAGGTYAPASAPGVVEWGGVNVGITPATGECPIAEATGTFSDGVLAPQWHRRYGSNACSETGGRLRLALPNAMSNACELASYKAYDMTGGAIVGDFPSMTSGADIQTRFGVGYTPLTTLTISHFNDAMMFEVYVDNVLQKQTQVAQRPPYDPVNHRRWRIRHEVPMTFIAELGTASGTYVELDRYTGAFPFQDVFPLLSGQSFNAVTPGVAELESINP